MALAINVTTADGETLAEPYLLRLGGWTEARYFAEAPESQIVEFEDGELIVPSPVSIRHQELVGFLTFLLRGYVSTKGLGNVFNGPAVVRLRPDLNYEPDIFVVRREHLSQLEAQFFSGGPDLVVEVMSPGGRSYDLKTKATNYRQYGVREYWLIDPATTPFYQHTCPTDDSAPYDIRTYATARVDSMTMPGFWVDASWFWERPLPQETRLLDRLLG